MEWEPIDDRIIAARINAKIQKITIIQCYAPTNNAEPYEKEEFYNKLQAVVNNAPNRDILIVMGDFNATVGRNNASIERIIGKEGLGDVNEYGEELVDLCELNRQSISGTLFLHKRVHKATWISPDGVTENQIDHILISQRWRTSLHVRVKKGANIGSDHHLVVASLKIKLAARKPFISTRRTFDVMKLRDPDTKQAFKIESQNRFESLFLQQQQQQQDGGEQAQDIDINVQWEKAKKILVDTCGSVLGRMKRTRKEWLSDETYRKIEERRKANQIMNDVRRRQWKREANRYYNEKNREVKKSCRRDKRNLLESIAREAEDAATNNDLRTLCMTTRKLSGIRCNQNRPIRSEDETLLTKMEDQLQRWKRHFESVLNRPAPSQIPDPRLV
ncbi:craniofacial development protein 2-like [Orbicella faveolata]|uniref:craniofacial development protein 2-like n=1 Tax=Orbicella faveolata TaxID=48498 RepID=UPI0009E2C662|nr:craniofacial development protein 2-like [Orbicella faveolata]